MDINKSELSYPLELDHNGLIGDQELVVLDWTWSSRKSPADRCTSDQKIKPLESWNHNLIVVVTESVLSNSCSALQSAAVLLLHCDELGISSFVVLCSNSSRRCDLTSFIHKLLYYKLKNWWLADEKSSTKFCSHYRKIVSTWTHIHIYIIHISEFIFPMTRISLFTFSLIHIFYFLIFLFVYIFCVHVNFFKISNL